MNCPKCHTPLADGMKTCPVCGFEMMEEYKEPAEYAAPGDLGTPVQKDLSGSAEPKMRKGRCPNCGSLLDENRSFCAQCGTRVQEYEQLLLQAKSKNPSAFARLCHTSRHRIKSYILFCLYPDLQQAESFLLEVVKTARNQMTTLDASMPFTLWMQKIAGDLFCARYHLTRQFPVEAVDSYRMAVTPSKVPSTAGISPMQRTILFEQLLQGMSLEQREVFYFACYEGKSEAEIAGIYSVSPEAIHVALSKAKLILDRNSAGMQIGKTALNGQSAAMFLSALLKDQEAAEIAADMEYAPSRAVSGDHKDSSRKSPEKKKPRISWLIGAAGAGCLLLGIIGWAAYSVLFTKPEEKVVQAETSEDAGTEEIETMEAEEEEKKEGEPAEEIEEETKEEEEIVQEEPQEIDQTPALTFADFAGTYVNSGGAYQNANMYVSSDGSFSEVIGLSTMRGMCKYEESGAFGSLSQVSETIYSTSVSWAQVTTPTGTSTTIDGIPVEYVDATGFGTGDIVTIYLAGTSTSSLDSTLLYKLQNFADSTISGGVLTTTVLYDATIQNYYFLS